MKSISRFERVNMHQQHGLVLFFALIALVVMSLAAVALIRSVDTSGMIAGNLAFKKAATSAGDAGIDAAVTWLATTDAAANAAGQNIMINVPAHTLNSTNIAKGYYANADPALVLFADATWDTITGIPEIVDGGDNHIRYIIQRMCRYPGVGVSTADCLFSSALQDTNNQDIPLPQDVCSGPGCPAAGQTPQIRITVRTKGPKNTVSYLQAFVY